MKFNTPTNDKFLQMSISQEISLRQPADTNDMFLQTFGYQEISPFGRNDTTNAGRGGGGESGASRPILLHPKATRGRGHFDQDTQRSSVLPGEIYSLMSSPHYAQNSWVNSRNDTTDAGSQGLT